MWKFNPSTGFYDNGVKKKEVEYSISKNFIKIDEVSYIPEIDKVKKKLDTEKNIDLNLINSFLEPKEKLLFNLLPFNIAGYSIPLLK